VTPGRILELGGFEEQQRSDSTGMAGSVSVVLDDRDGAMKAMFDGVDLHKKRVNIYQSFVGVPDEDKILVFRASCRRRSSGTRASGPSRSTWSPSSRTWRSASRRDGHLRHPPPGADGQAWPMVFGTVHHSPCLRLQNIPTAFTTDAFGIGDRTVDTELAALQACSSWRSPRPCTTRSRPRSRPTRSTSGRDPERLDVQSYVQMQRDIQEQINELKLATVAGRTSDGAGRPDPHRVRHPALQRPVPRRATASSTAP
jgi:hypothetical protein